MDEDRTDPGVRAADALEQTERRERRARIGAALALLLAAGVAPFVASPLTGSGGATIGAVVFSLLAVILAWAVWPLPWAPEERLHHQLESVWRQVRSTPDDSVPWSRYAAWADPVQGEVELVLIEALPSTAHVASPYRHEVFRRLDADAVGIAAEEMERLREIAGDRELESRLAYQNAIATREQQAHETRMTSLDAEAAAEAHERDEQLRLEEARREAAEKKAQAAAVARALRRR